MLYMQVDNVHRVVVYELDLHTMVTGNKSMKEATKEVLTTSPDPPQAGGVKAVPETGKGSLLS